MSKATRSGQTEGRQRPARNRRMRRPSIFVATAFAVAGLTSISAPASTALAAPSPATSICDGYGSATFGPNVCVFSPSTPQATIQTVLDNIATQQFPASNQFDNQRYAVFFEPGTYGASTDPLVFQVGYYTEIAGLGAMPQDTIINGEAQVINQCSGGNCQSDNNMWRSLYNLTLNVVVPTATELSNIGGLVPGNGATPPFPNCETNSEFWSASQATPIRRAIINGTMFFQEYCGNENYASGGFIADSEFENGTMQFDGNQQYMVRNTDIDTANGCAPDNGGLWDNVFSGDDGAPVAEFGGQCDQNTVIATSPVTEEEPFLYTGPNGGLDAFVPAVQHNTTGPAWADGSATATTPAEPGSSSPLSSFFVANPSTPVLLIDAALAQGHNLILTPGVYNLDAPIVAPHPDTVIMGLGFATLVPQNGNAALLVVRNSGVKISGLIIDAGPVNSPVLMSVGTPANDPASATDPDLISDVFFRVGGAETTPVSANISLLDNADNSIIDDVWAWRADHGNDVGWTVNQGATGLDVTGDNVTAYGLAVEHYQKYEVIWSGQGGTDIFFQNELPYDPPTQADWMAAPTQDGYPSFFVTPNVRTFQGYGWGSYVVFIDTSATLFDAEAYETPDTPGVQLHDLTTVWIGGSGGDNSIINGTGGPDTSTNPGKVAPVDVVSYP
jgi:hypothetical protein